MIGQHTDMVTYGILIAISLQFAHFNNLIALKRKNLPQSEFTSFHHF